MRNERELAKYFEQRKGDASTWPKDATKAQVANEKNVVFSLRLPAEELETLRLLASWRKTSVSDLIRSAIADCIFARRLAPTPANVVLISGEAIAGYSRLDAAPGRHSFGVAWGISAHGQGFEPIQDGGVDTPSNSVRWIPSVPVEGFVRSKSFVATKEGA